MTLSPQDTARFYRIWWPLLNYVNAKRGIFPDFPASPKEGSINPQQADSIRQVLWESEILREAFIAENPAALPVEDLALVASWRDRVAGYFFIFRHLKRHTVFLTEARPPRAYGVLGLVSPIAEVVPPPLPVLVNAVLLPFEDKIIYDGLLKPYNVVFGSGIRADLEASYQEVRERSGVITTLQPLDVEAIRERLRSGNQKVLAAFRKDLAASGLSLKKMDQHLDNIAEFADQLLAQDPPRSVLDITADDLQACLDERGAEDRRVSFKRFVRFLLNSGRIDWEAGVEMQDLLKQKKGR